MKGFDPTNLLELARNIQNDVDKSGMRCLEEPAITSSQIIPVSIFKNCSKAYLLIIVKEINSCYENGIHCGCAVLIRRLLETCMIEAFVQKGKATLIKKDNGDYKGCTEIRDELRKDPFGNLTRNAKKALNNNNIIQIGHNAAHDRFWIPRKQDIDKIKDESRTLVEYLVHQL